MMPAKDWKFGDRFRCLRWSLIIRLWDMIQVIEKFWWLYRKELERLMLENNMWNHFGVCFD
jgi:hypothetical protein